MTVGTDSLTLRVLARHAQLVRALRQDDLKDVARAGSRARLTELRLLPSERAASQLARATIGRAIREARLRAKQPRGDVEIAQVVTAPRRRRRGRTIALSLVTLLLLLAVIGWSTLPPAESAPTEAADPGGAPAGDVVAQAQTNENSRGRTSELYAIAPVPTVEPSPTPEAT